MSTKKKPTVKKGRLRKGFWQWDEHSENPFRTALEKVMFFDDLVTPLGTSIFKDFSSAMLEKRKKYMEEDLKKIQEEINRQSMFNKVVITVGYGLRRSPKRRNNLPRDSPRRMPVKSPEVTLGNNFSGDFIVRGNKGPAWISFFMTRF